MLATLEPFTTINIQQYLEFAIPSYIEAMEFQKTTQNIEKNSQKIRKRTTVLLNQLIQASQRVSKKKGTNILFNTLIRVEGKIISTAFHCDMQEFLNTVRYKINTIEVQNFPYQFLKNVRIDQSLVGFQAVVRKQWKNKNFFMNHIIAANQHLAKYGYENSFGWTVNPIALKAWEKMKSKNIKTTILRNEQGKQFSITYGVVNANTHPQPSL